MADDVIKVAGLEFYSITGYFPEKNLNFKKMNTFKNEFNN